MTLLIPKRIFILATLYMINFSASAQYVWIDANGNKQFSDQPPPSIVPKHKILKDTSSLASEPSTSLEEPGTKPSENLTEKNIAFKKRQAELKTKQKKETEQAQLAAEKSAYCQRVQSYKQELDSGARINEVDANGARGYMSDEKRIHEKNEVAEKMENCAH